MILDSSSSGLESKYKADICIIGGGVAGLVLASELAAASKTVVVVESGGINFDPDTQALNRSQSYDKPLPIPEYSRLRMWGGSSNHWENNTSVLDPIDFQKRDWIPYSGWPIEFSDIAPYYEKAQQYCGVGLGDYSSDIWASALGVPDLLKGSSVLLSQIYKMAVPPTRFMDAVGKHLIDVANVQLISGFSATTVKYKSATKKVDSVSAVSLNGKKIELEAENFVLACGGIENARLLLQFNAQHENQLGNQSDLIGRFFMEHPTPRAAHLYVDDPSQFEFYQSHIRGAQNIGAFFSLTEDALRSNQTTNLRIPLFPQTRYIMSEGISSSHILLDSMATDSWPEHASQHLLNIVSDLPMLIEAISRKKFDTKLFDSANEIAGYELPMMMEQTPDPTNRVELGSSKDALGMPRVKLRYQLKNADKQRVWSALRVVAREVGIRSIGRLQLLEHRSSRVWGDQLGFSNHHMGTTRMAESASDGVVDSDCRVFGVDNVFVAGSSVFATGGHVPPTLTIVALAMRLAKRLSDV